MIAKKMQAKYTKREEVRAMFSRYDKNQNGLFRFNFALNLNLYPFDTLISV